MLFKNKNFQAIKSCQELLNSGTSIDREVVESMLERATLKKAKEGLEDNTQVSAIRIHNLLDSVSFLLCYNNWLYFFTYFP